MLGKIVNGPYDWRGIESKADVAFCLAVIAGVTLVEAGSERGFWRRLFRRRRLLRVGAALFVLLLTLLVGEFDGGRFVYVRF